MNIPDAPLRNAPVWLDHNEASAWEGGFEKGWGEGYAAALANRELCVLMYLHDWDPTGKVYPEVSGIYLSWQEAETARLAKSSPEKYHIRQGNCNSA